MVGMKSVDPSSGEVVGNWEEHTLQQLDNALVTARDAYHLWREEPIAERAGHLKRVATRLRENRGELALLMTREMGKPVTQAESEVEKCAWACEHFAENAPRYLAEEPVKTEASYSAVRCDPLGPILSIMPWNFPLWQVFRFAAPALMAGNTVLLKHAEGVAGCSLAIERQFAAAGFPPGVFTSLLVSHDAVDRLIAHPVVAAVTLTGSVRAGRAVAASAGRHLKKCVLELGGSDPFIVLADADLNEAVEVAAKARTINSGQSCIAAKRFIVEESIAERFEEAFAERMKKLRVGDPKNRETEIGPLARLDLRDALHAQVMDAVDQGARLLTGGKPLEGAGFFYPPTVLSGVVPGMRAFDEETFGPVAAITRADHADHAVRLANHSPFGLGASIWTRNVDRGRDLARRIHAGSVFVNSMVVSDPRLPFGGIKDSGYGRELGRDGIRELVNIKTVSVA